MRMTVAQYALMLDVARVTEQVYAHYPEMGFDQMPQAVELTLLNKDWQLAAQGPKYD